MFTTLDCIKIDKEYEDNVFNIKEVSNKNDYFPVGVGDKWNYVIEEVDSKEKDYDVEIDCIEKVDGDVVVEFSSFPFFWLKEEKTTLKINESGVVFLVDENKNENLFIPKVSDLKKGFNWKMGEWNASVVDTEEIITTRNESFDECIHINFTLSITFNSEIWLAKNTGIVKWGFNRTNPPSLKFSYYILEEFELN
jgi:hypothetical protein